MTRTTKKHKLSNEQLDQLDVFNLGQAAQFLGCSQPWLSNLLHTKDAPPSRINGGRRFFTRRSLLDWIDNHGKKYPALIKTCCRSGILHSLQSTTEPKSVEEIFLEIEEDIKQGYQEALESLKADGTLDYDLSTGMVSLLTRDTKKS